MIKNLKQRFFQKNVSSDQVKIVLCATMRCGSTMVGEDMRNTQSLGHAKEFLTRWKPNGKYSEKQLRNIMKKNTTENGVFSVKVMSKYLPNIENCLKPDNKSIGADPAFPYFATVMNDAVWVYLRREDIIGQALSRYISNVTGVFHNFENQRHKKTATILAQKGESTYSDHVKYNFGIINRSVQNIVKEQLIWENFFSTNKIEPIRLTYENCIGDLQGYLSQIAEAANVDLAIMPEKRTIKKLSTSRSDDFRKQYLADLVKKIEEGSFSKNTPPAF